MTTQTQAPVGIDCLRFHVPGHYLDLALLATARDVPHAKYTAGLGQEIMALPAPDEDVLTLAAAAGEQAMSGQDAQQFDLLILATESGVDASKAGAIWLHRLLGMPARCQAFDVQQACCGGTVALQLALAHVRLQPSRRVLVVAADVARYELGSPGEPTQGAGAAAFVVAAEPRLLVIDGPVGVHTEDVMDFWRPPHRRTALVDGKLSIRMYMKALRGAYADYRRQGGAAVAELSRFCYHLPFTRMAEKAHAHLLGELDEPARLALQPGMAYNRLIGNSYTASLYISLASMLENTAADLAGLRLGLYAYGSGCMGLFVNGRVAPGYRDALAADAHRRMLLDRRAVDFATYERWQATTLPQDGSDVELPAIGTGPYRLEGLTGHVRRYARRHPPAAANATDAGLASA